MIRIRRFARDERLAGLQSKLNKLPVFKSGGFGDVDVEETIRREACGVGHAYGENVVSMIRHARQPRQGSVGGDGQPRGAIDFFEGERVADVEIRISGKFSQRLAGVGNVRQRGGSDDRIRKEERRMVGILNEDDCEGGITCFVRPFLQVQSHTFGAFDEFVGGRCDGEDDTGVAIRDDHAVGDMLHNPRR